MQTPQEADTPRSSPMKEEEAAFRISKSFQCKYWTLKTRDKRIQVRIFLIVVPLV